MNMEPKPCRICDSRIPKARREVSPNTVTCSSACTEKYQRVSIREAAKRYYLRQKAKRAGLEPALEIAKRAGL